MTKAERAELADMMRALQQAATESIAYNAIRPWFNQIVNRFDLPPSVYDDPRTAAEFSADQISKEEA